MTRTWFTSDTHFGHAAIIRLCGRPFSDVAEMDSALVEAWNSRIGPGDAVWHLGDFSYRNAQSAQSYLTRLNGQKHLIHGNHDSAEAREAPGWASSQTMAEITADGHRLVLLHYGMRVWPRSHYGSIHLYGHSHGQLSGDHQSLDVGVDCWGYQPVSLSEIRERLATLPPRGATAQHPG